MFSNANPSEAGRAAGLKWLAMGAFFAALMVQIPRAQALEGPIPDRVEVWPLSDTLEDLTLPGRAERLESVARYGTVQLVGQYAALYFAEPDNWKAHGNTLEPSWRKFRSNFSRRPIYEPVAMGGGGLLGIMQADGDPWVTNVVGHGLQGSEVYLRMRVKGFSRMEAALAGLVHSTAWEYGVEGWNETPSAWDLAYTPVGGALFGELRYQAWTALDRVPNRWYVKGLRFLVDPVGEFVDVAKNAPKTTSRRSSHVGL